MRENTLLGQHHKTTSQHHSFTTKRDLRENNIQVNVIKQLYNITTSRLHNFTTSRLHNFTTSRLLFFHLRFAISGPRQLFKQNFSYHYVTNTTNPNYKFGIFVLSRQFLTKCFVKSFNTDSIYESNNLNISDICLRKTKRPLLKARNYL